MLEKVSIVSQSILRLYIRSQKKCSFAFSNRRISENKNKKKKKKKRVGNAPWPIFVRLDVFAPFF